MGKRRHALWRALWQSLCVQRGHVSSPAKPQRQLKDESESIVQGGQQGRRAQSRAEGAKIM